MNSEKIWREIPGYEGLYKASNDGEILSEERVIVRKDGVVQRKSEMILSPATNASGYYQVSLRKEGKANSFLVSRLVAMTFIENPLNLPEVNHKNEIKTDNRVENLEWVSRRENCNFGTRNKRHSAYMKGKYTGREHSHPRPVICLTTGEKFECISAAAKAYGMKSTGSLSACCRGKNKHAGTMPDGTKLEWEYDN